LNNYFKFNNCNLLSMYTTNLLQIQTEPFYGKSVLTQMLRTIIYLYKHENRNFCHACSLPTVKIDK